MTGRQLFVRSILTLALPITVGGVFFGRLVDEIRGAFWFAWERGRIEFENYLQQMRRTDY